MYSDERTLLLVLLHLFHCSKIFVGRYTWN